MSLHSGHPRFKKFYQKLREEGYLIGIGDTSKVRATGDIIAIDAIPEFDRNLNCLGLGFMQKIL